MLKYGISVGSCKTDDTVDVVLEYKQQESGEKPNT